MLAGWVSSRPALRSRRHGQAQAEEGWQAHASGGEGRRQGGRGGDRGRGAVVIVAGLVEKAKRVAGPPGSLWPACSPSRRSRAHRPPAATRRIPLPSGPATPTMAVLLVVLARRLGASGAGLRRRRRSIAGLRAGPARDRADLARGRVGHERPPERGPPGRADRSVRVV